MMLTSCVLTGMTNKAITPSETSRVDSTTRPVARVRRPPIRRSTRATSGARTTAMKPATAIHMTMRAAARSTTIRA